MAFLLALALALPVAEGAVYGFAVQGATATRQYVAIATFGESAATPPTHTSPSVWVTPRTLFCNVAFAGTPGGQGQYFVTQDLGVQATALLTVDVATGAIVRQVNVSGPGATFTITSMAFSPDAQLIYATAMDETDGAWGVLSLSPLTGETVAVVAMPDVDTVPVMCEAAYGPPTPAAAKGTYVFTWLPNEQQSALIFVDIATGAVTKRVFNSTLMSFLTAWTPPGSSAWEVLAMASGAVGARTELVSVVPAGAARVLYTFPAAVDVLPTPGAQAFDTSRQLIYTPVRTTNGTYLLLVNVSLPAPSATLTSIDESGAQEGIYGLNWVQ